MDVINNRLYSDNKLQSNQKSKNNFGFIDTLFSCIASFGCSEKNNSSQKLKNKDDFVVLSPKMHYNSPKEENKSLSSDINTTPSITFSYLHDSLNKRDPQEIRNRLIYIDQCLKKSSLLNYDINEENGTVTFHHGYEELAVFLKQKELKKVFWIDLPSEKNAPYPMQTDRFNPLRDPRSVLEKGIVKLVEVSKELQQKNNRSVSIDPNITSLPELLENYPGYIIGETHSHISPKRQIIDQMHDLKERGLSVIYLENIFHDSMQNQLDEYYKTGKMPSLLKRELEMMNSALRFTGKKTEHGYKEIVETAQKEGIRVVAIDTTVSHLSRTYPVQGFSPSESRIRAMNTIALEIISQDQKQNPGKYIALVGTKHAASVKRFNGMPGLAEMLHVPSVVIHDANPFGVTYNQHNIEDFQIENTSDELSFVSMYMPVRV